MTGSRNVSPRRGTTSLSSSSRTMSPGSSFRAFRHTQSATKLSLGSSESRSQNLVGTASSARRTGLSTRARSGSPSAPGRRAAAAKVCPQSVPSSSRSTPQSHCRSAFHEVPEAKVSSTPKSTRRTLATPESFKGRKTLSDRRATSSGPRLSLGKGAPAARERMKMASPRLETGKGTPLNRSRTDLGVTPRTSETPTLLTSRQHSKNLASPSAPATPEVGGCSPAALTRSSSASVMLHGHSDRRSGQTPERAGETPSPDIDLRTALADCKRQLEHWERCTKDTRRQLKESEQAFGVCQRLVQRVEQLFENQDGMLFQSNEGLPISPFKSTGSVSDLMDVPEDTGLFMERVRERQKNEVIVAVPCNPGASAEPENSTLDTSAGDALLGATSHSTSLNCGTPRSACYEVSPRSAVKVMGASQPWMMWLPQAPRPTWLQEQLEEDQQDAGFDREAELQPYHPQFLSICTPPMPLRNKLEPVPDR